MRRSYLLRWLLAYICLTAHGYLILHKRCRSIHMAGPESSIDEEKMKFGNRMSIKLKLPCRDEGIATAFISDTDRLIRALWMDDKCRKLQDDRYLLIMNSIGIPGFNTITPEIEVQLSYSDGFVSLQSVAWSLKGDSDKVLKDSRFMSSFDIVLSGELNISPVVSSSSSTSASSVEQPAQAIMEAIGKVEYRVEGLKPKIFRAAPPFVLTSVINLIQEGVVEYTETQFSARFLKAFRSYLLAAMAESRAKAS